jgi:hypothetical protein
VRKISFVFCLCLFAAQTLTPSTRAGLGQVKRAGVVGVGEAAVAPPNIASLYRGSYALVIGISKYEHWARLPGVKDDVAQVACVLKQHGFEVEVAEDLDSDRLLPVIQNFLKRDDVGPQSRLLVYYAGHGHRYVPKESARGVGFIVPRDAPLPDRDRASFLAKAVNMDELLAPASTVKAKHALFVLDSCYAGSLIDGAVFNSAAARVEREAPARFVPSAWKPAAAAQDPEVLPYIPPVILSKVGEPVREFIASGTYKQSVPDDSEFRRRFVAALTDESGAGADANGDSYVTGAELGEYLQQNVTNKSEGSQRPIWCIVGSKAASQGDFVFIMPGATAREVSIGPIIDPLMWDMPAGWRYADNSVHADTPGLMLPQKLVRHSFRDFKSATRLKLANGTAARFVLRAQGRGDYYLIRLTAGKFPDKEGRFVLSAHVVRGGTETAELTGSPLPVDERKLVKRLNYKDAIEVVIVAEGDTFTVSLLAGEGNAGGLPLMAPVKFVDKQQTFRYGAPGYLTADGEQLQIFTSHVRKLEPSEKGGT